MGQKKEINTEQEMRMTYSGIVVADGKKKVSVTFERGSDLAELSIPECKVTKSHGFEDDELIMLEKYVQINQIDIINKAKEITGIRGLMR